MAVPVRSLGHLVVMNHRVSTSLRSLHRRIQVVGLSLRAWNHLVMSRQEWMNRHNRRRHTQLGDEQCLVETCSMSRRNLHHRTPVLE